MDRKYNIKSKFYSVRNHVHRHRGKYVALGITTMWLMLTDRNSKAWDRFLVEKGIDPLEYWCPEAYEEKLNS